MKIAAKPTTYNHVRFRSRLEATWAAFFDLCGWRWEYEPIDLDGWVPDFYLFPISGPPIPVEVKPIEWESTSHDRMIASVEERHDLEKVFKYLRYFSENAPDCYGFEELSRYEKSVLILGAYPPDNLSNTWDEGRFGAIITSYTSSDLAVLGVTDDGRYDFFGEMIDYTSRIHGINHKKNLYASGYVVEAFRKARNATQWMAR